VNLSREQIGVLAAAGAAVIFGIAFPATAVALRSFEPLAVAGISCSLGLGLLVTLIALGVVPPAGLDGLDRGRGLRLLALGLLSGFGFILAMNISIELAGPTIAAFVATLYAVLAVLFAIPILGEPVRPMVLVALLLSLVGTTLLAGFRPLDSSVAGIAFGLLAAVTFGLYLVLARRWGRKYRLGGTLVAIAILIGRGPAMLLVELVRDPGALLPSDPDPAAIAALLYLAVGPNLVAQLLILASVERVPAQRTSASLLLTPIAAAVLSFLLLGDLLDPIELVGAGLVLLGIAGASGAIESLATRLRPSAVPTSPPDGSSGP
jgi:probable blue pigment (indigoidine) exporter